MAEPRQDILPRTVRVVWPVLVPILLISLFWLLGYEFGNELLQRVITLGLISVGVTVGLYTFSGNSGVLSFGHLSFMALGAYVSALLTIPPILKESFFTFPGALKFLNHTELSPWVAIVIGAAFAAVFAALVGTALMRLSGMEASIGTLALLLIVNVVTANWDGVTLGGRTVVGVPQVVGPGGALLFAIAVILIAYTYQRSTRGRRLRTSREDAAVATALGVNVFRERWIAYVLSAALVGAGGGMYAHFSAGFNPNNFFLDPTFLYVAMLIIGGMHSLGGAVTGTIAVVAFSEFFRRLDAGMTIAGLHLKVASGVGDILLGLCILLVLVFRPEGIVGGREIMWPFTRWRKSSIPATIGEQAPGEAVVPPPSSFVRQ